MNNVLEIIVVMFFILEFKICFKENKRVKVYFSWNGLRMIFCVYVYMDIYAVEMFEVYGFRFVRFVGIECFFCKKD